MGGFLSALGTGLMGAVGGAADSFAGSMDQKIANRDKLANEQALMEMRDKMEQQREARLKADKIKENQAVISLAGEKANAERGAQMDQAAEIYRKSGMSEEDIALGIGATETARAEKVEPTRDNIRAAMSEGGFLSAGDLVNDMDKREGVDYTRSRDAASDERTRANDEFARTDADRKYELDQQRVNISASQARSSIAASNLQLKAAQLAFKQAQETAKIPPMAMKKYESLAADAKAIQSAMYKAEADGTLTPEASVKLAERLGTITQSMDSLANNYLSDADKTQVKSGKPDPNDPLGLGLTPKKPEKAAESRPDHKAESSPAQNVRLRAELEAKHGRGRIPATAILDNPEAFTQSEIAAAKKPKLLRKWDQGS